MADDGAMDQVQDLTGPRAVQIIIANPDHTFSLDEEALKSILLQNDVKDRNVVVVSVAGAFRHGKSFLLDFFLRYMRSKYVLKQNSSQWLGASDQPLDGFSWKGGSERDTTGILMWSEVFLTELVTGEKVAVLLMDTQGTFDSQSTVKECATIFALSTMLSSVQIYNLNSNIQEDDLQHLQLFTEYGKLAMEDNGSTFDNIETKDNLNTKSNVENKRQSGEKQLNITDFDKQLNSHGNLRLRNLSNAPKDSQIVQNSQETKEPPFQRLQFLVRDWRFPYEAEYGAIGGQKILEKRLKITENCHNELKQLRLHIKQCFSELACFLMPHPGNKVATNPQFDGKLKDIDEEFVDNLRILVPMLLSPENLVLKKINGDFVKCKDLVRYCQSYLNIYQMDNLPEPKSVLVATAQANNLSAVADSKDMYIQLMEDLCGGAKPYININKLTEGHDEIRQRCIQMFWNRKKMGGVAFSESYCEDLQMQIDELFANYVKHNEGKNVFSAARTPAVFFGLCVFCYILSGVFGLVGVYSVANLCNVGMMVCLLALTIWAYIGYSGEMRDVAVYLDEIATFIWENLLKSIVTEMAQNVPVQELAERTILKTVVGANIGNTATSSNSAASKKND